MIYICTYNSRQNRTCGTAYGSAASPNGSKGPVWLGWNRSGTSRWSLTRRFFAANEPRDKCLIRGEWVTSLSEGVHNEVDEAYTPTADTSRWILKRRFFAANERSNMCLICGESVTSHWHTATYCNTLQHTATHCTPNAETNKNQWLVCLGVWSHTRRHRRSWISANEPSNVCASEQKNVFYIV